MNDDIGSAVGSTQFHTTTAATSGGVPFLSKRFFFHKERKMDNFRKVYLENKTQIYTRVFLKGHFVKEKNVHPTT